MLTKHLKQESAAHADTTCGRPSQLLCQLQLTGKTSPLSLNAVLDTLWIHLRSSRTFACSFSHAIVEQFLYRFFHCSFWQSWVNCISGCRN